MSAEPDEVQTAAQELSDVVRDVMNLWRQYPFADAWHIAPHIEGCECSMTVHNEERLTLALGRSCPVHGPLVEILAETYGGDE